MNKQEIITAIKHIANKNNGKAPGFQRFSAETGLRKSEWYPQIWFRWGDAIKEAGCQPNEFISAYDASFLIEKYIELIREVGHFPIEGELRIKNSHDNNFPSHGTFNQLGSKQERILKIIAYCKTKIGYDDVITHCEKAKKDTKEEIENIETGKYVVGYVYLLQHGTRNEYKIGRTYNPIRREGEIRIELPDKVQPIHYIKTDDPAGIENYWHTRFASKRKEGEWFTLTTEDVKAFKKWHKIY